MTEGHDNNNAYVEWVHTPSNSVSGETQEATDIVTKDHRHEMTAATRESQFQLMSDWDKVATAREGCASSGRLVLLHESDQSADKTNEEEASSIQDGRHTSLVQRSDKRGPTTIPEG